MKTILVPTDFSKASMNAVNYAAEFAKQLNSKMVLFHVCYTPVTGNDFSVEPYSYEDIEKSAVENLEKVIRELEQKHGRQLNMEYAVRFGFTVEEINSIAHECHADLIVMGMRGVGYLAEKLIGSVTAALIRKAACPVLVINEDVSFKPVKKIVLASDFQEEETSESLLPLKEIAENFGARIYVINVVKQKLAVPSSPDEIIDFDELDHRFSGIAHTVHFLRGNDLVDQLNQFIAENKMDMVVMTPHKRPFFEAVFHLSKTRQMAFHSQVPMLALHEIKVAPSK